MAKIDAYLMFEGNCAEAMRFYERTLGGKLFMMTNAESPMADKMPPGRGDKILHARLDLDGRMLMASDSPNDESKKGFSLSLIYDTVPDARRIFDALAEGGQTTMAFQKTFWAEGFGMLVDRFGTPWMVGGAMASM